MLILLPTDANKILKEKYYKRDTVKSFCFDSSKIIFVLLTEIVADHLVITFISIRKAYLKEIFT